MLDQAGQRITVGSRLKQVTALVAMAKTLGRQNKTSLATAKEIGKTPQTTKTAKNKTWPLRVGTDCSGLEVPVRALEELKVSYEHMFASDVDKVVRRQHRQDYQPNMWYDDLMFRDNKLPETPSVDLYIAGFPCQPFSAAGKQRGFKDHQGRGNVFFGCADYIECKRPNAFILENVKRLLSIDHGRTFKKIMRTLRKIGDGAYHVQSEVIDTQDHGVPHSRPRVYMVGIRQDCQRSEFRFPQVLPRVSLESFLDPVERQITMEDLPPETNMEARQNVKRILEKLEAKGKTPLTRPFSIDHQSSANRCGYMEDKVMCMTRSRPRGHWITSRGREMNLDEMHRCQGMERTSKQLITDAQLGAQIGNSMSQNVVERILIQLLPAAGLVSPSCRLVDRWDTRAFVAKSISHSDIFLDEIFYSGLCQDTVYEYRHAMLPESLSKEALRLMGSEKRLLKESEWRSLGIQHSGEWENFGTVQRKLHAPVLILKFRRLLLAGRIYEDKNRALYHKKLSLGPRPSMLKPLWHLLSMFAKSAVWAFTNTGVCMGYL